MAKDDEEDEFAPTAEQTEAYRQTVVAYMGHTLFDAMAARLPANSLRAHRMHPDCVVIPSLGAALAVCEMEDKTVGIAVPALHKDWINAFAFDFIAVSHNEVFFISKSFTWLNSEIQALAISLGPMIPSELLARMCNQRSVMFYAVDDVANPTTTSLLRPDEPVLVFHTIEGVPLFQTRATYERRARAERIDPDDAVETFFQG